MSAPLPQAPRVRGWCPGVRRPMETGDGLLVRVHPPGGVLGADEARLVAEAARTFGNGLLDVTARGNLQIRGVRPATYPALLARLDEAGLVEPEGDGPNRLTLVSPFSGIDPAERLDARPLAAAVEEAADVRDLPGKVFVAVDGGGIMPLVGSGADIVLTAVAGPTPIAVGLAAPEGPRWIGATRAGDAPEVVRALLQGFAALRRDGRTGVGRIRDLDEAQRAVLAARVALAPRDAPPLRPACPRTGLVPSHGGTLALLAALAFGRCNADQLARAADWSRAHGSGEIRPSPSRGLVLPGIPDPGIILREAEAAGFIVDPADPRLAVSACPGAPSCGAGRVPAPSDAAPLAEAASHLLAAGLSLHVSGCPKGCAHPGRADVTLVGQEDGCYGLVPGGTARDPAVLRLSLDEVMTRLREAPTPGELARALREPAL
ncbi:precorrin-3B synthase [Salinarimonas soli]|uniref:Precorrin-3B synthase n=1 Tax=Salinarimonas soli TaxID=1638099 RepID=A0A5B2VVK0_9HYPH|nr:precorrin-3B synthase [Salinarimonas soli]KAA2242307.1 precorrin-3B synthase [Salinarimonas soli]